MRTPFWRGENTIELNRARFVRFEVEEQNWNAGARRFFKFPLFNLVSDAPNFLCCV